MLIYKSERFTDGRTIEFSYEDLYTPYMGFSIPVITIRVYDPNEVKNGDEQNVRYEYPF